MTWSPSAATRLYGLLGHPVSHSLSPALHNAAFRALGDDACYLAFDVIPEDLAGALAGARALGVQGLNVTVPHKEAALALADGADPLARRIGAANTLVRTPTGWRAHNTDAAGLLRALEAELGFRPHGRRCLILGAGGAARAAAAGLAAEGAQEIRIANRNETRAVRLADELGPPTVAVPVPGAWEGLGAGDLVVSATPLGLSPSGRWPWEPSRLPPGLRVYDMAYRAGAETPLVDEARAAGLCAASGRAMLLHQGAAAFTLWTGVPPPLEAMARALTDNRD